MAKIGGQTGDFMIYLDGKDLIGVAECVLPELKFKTATLSGAGILGDINYRNKYALELECKFNTITDDSLNLMDISGKLLELKAAIIEADGSTHAIGQSGLRAVMRGETISGSLGTVKINEFLNSSFKMEITACEVFKGGKQLYKVDKFAGIIEQFGSSMLKKLTELF